jgi:hypothetical protein
MDHEVLTSRFPPAANALKTPVVCLFMQQIECACHGVLAHVPRPFSSAVDLFGQRLHAQCGVPLSLSGQITDHRVERLPCGTVDRVGFLGPLLFEQCAVLA